MAQIVLQPKNAGNHYAILVTVNYTETNVNNNNNTSDVYYEVILSRNQWSTNWYGFGQKIYVDVVINGVLNRIYIPRYNYNGQNLPNSIFGSGTVTGISHNDDGSKTIDISASIVDNAGATYTSGSASASSTMVLTNIPRYATITSFIVNQIDETSLGVSWSANAPCDYAWYRIRQSGGSYGDWIDVGSTEFNITGLSAGTTYIVQIQVRRQDSQLITQSGEYRQTTIAYPYANITPNFTIGNACTLGIHNPLNRTCKIYIKNPLNTEKELETITGQTTTIPNTSEWRTFLYNGIPNSMNGLYRVRVVCDEVSHDITTNGGTYNVDASVNKPNVSNYSASYVANLTNLTNNNQTVINNVSTITYTINTGATAQNGASISEYTVTWGDATPQKITNISNPATLVKGNGNTISVTVKDSRGITNTVSTSISEVINYTSPTQLGTSLNRLDGVGEDVFIDVSGIIYYDKFGTNGVSNKITDIKYSILNETAQNVSVSLSSLAYTDQSIANHTQKFSITNAPISIDGVGGGFDATKTYNAIIVVTDTSGTTASITGTIKDGKFALDGIQNENGDYCYGINGLANEDYALTVHNKILSESTLDIGTQLNNDFRTNILYSHNLFNKNNAYKISGYIDENANKIISDTNSRTIYINIEGGKTYTISKLQTSVFKICTTQTTSSINVAIDDYLRNDTATSLTITTSSSAKFLCVNYYSSSDTTSEQDVLNSIMINEGSEALTYEQYVSPSINIDGQEIYNKNINYYSTNEQIIGRWIDGKPIYRKAFSGTFLNTQVLISNALLINAYGHVDVGTGRLRQMPYYEYYNNKAYCARIGIIIGTDSVYYICVDSMYNGDPANMEGSFVVEYIKLTD